MLQALGDEALSRLDTLNEQGLANLGWAFAVFDEPHPLFAPESPYWTLAAERFSNMRELCQLHQTLLWCEERDTPPAAAT